jgi:hypothetical protein
VRSPKNEGRRIDLPYGSHPYPLDLAGGDAAVLAPPTLPEPPPLETLLDRALDEAPLPALPAHARVTIIISDPTRSEPRAGFLAALRHRLPGATITITVATGTHGPCDVNRLRLPHDVPIINHDGATDTVEIGTTTRGTPVRIHRCILDADLVIASDALPVTASLYQAAKIAAAAAPLVDDDGTLVIVAQCPDGTGPLDVVNEAIFRIGVLPRLPRGAQLALVSDLAPATVAATLVALAPSIANVLARAPGRVVVIPRASQLICEATS